MYRFIFATLIAASFFQSHAESADPTKPLANTSQVGVEQVKKGLTLETIISRDKNKSAIISGKLMKVGDYIGDHELIAVNSSNVILRSNGERITLSMFSNVVTK